MARQVQLASSQDRWQRRPTGATGPHSPWPAGCRSGGVCVGPGHGPGAVRVPPWVLVAAFAEDEELETALTRADLEKLRDLPPAVGRPAPEAAISTAVETSRCPECQRSSLQPGQSVCGPACRKKRRARQERDRRSKALGRPAVVPLVTEAAPALSNGHSSPEGLTEALAGSVAAPSALTTVATNGSALQGADLVGLVAGLAQAGLLVRLQAPGGVSLEVMTR